MIKKYFPITLAIWPYLISIPVFFKIDIVLFYLPTLLIILLANILFVCLSNADNIVHRFIFLDMVIKLAHIPVYLFIFVIGLGAILLAPLLFIVDLVLMITSSMYGIVALIHAKNEGIITSKLMLIHIILHLFFVTDLISTIILYRKLNKINPNDHTHLSST